MKFLKSMIGILLIPVVIGFGRAFYVNVSGISILSGTLHVLERGVLAYLLMHVMLLRPAYLYVLGHEFVHVLATWLCGGRVVSFSVKPSGGNVVTSKSNVFIELSPYFVPIYTVLLGPVFLLLEVLGYKTPHTVELFIFLVGFTLAFHFSMTSEVLRMEQPDIIKSGLIFSLVFILLCNLIVTIAVVSPVFDGLSFVGFFKESIEYSRDIYLLIYERTLEFVNRIQI
ncbi:MAG: hypothetical protein GF409_07950 [Candidatus Omnitrophica bacterium]|nr:hypothetical protein [Candidatus Omnitrophota bacterium]